MKVKSSTPDHVYKPLEGRRIIFGVSGGIAAYKAADYARNLTKLGAKVKVVMTENGARFVCPLTFSALTGNKCLVSMFQEEETGSISHIDLARWGEVFVIVPATANVIAKTASGIADDLLTTLFLAFKGRKILFPAMNPVMFENPMVQENISRLKANGVWVAEPDEGTVACGDRGRGRLPEFERVLFLTRRALARQDLKGLIILVTSGPTREPIDPVRFISNRSSGRMGFALANIASIRGARVQVVSGPTCIGPPAHVPTIQVETAEEMADQVLSEAPGMDMVVMAAAVSDYRPASFSDSKIKKSQDKMILELEKTTDILSELGKRKGPNQILVGFCAETENVIENGFKKLGRKNLDLMVANDVTEPGAGFDCETNKVYLIDSEENVEELPLLHKEEVAERIFHKAVEIRARML